ncbi:hypothetical protein [Segetibacter aerophilus]|uniref:Uncharacterized protein n=1 Tax=Segetibacter aerophilus TaxID=670293 RepID=A0A512B9S9_9BACT|nr:hypothetical protein [Segetibacter aerophilus]GEO08718.1 hypothetical protein SAE01_12140 [Segetibacter aerophilus]
MCLILKAATMPGLKKRITLSAEPIKITEDSVLFQYLMDGRLRFLSLYKGEEAALFFYERGIICDYEGLGKRLKMYKKKIHCREDKTGTPVMWESQVEFTWEDVLMLHGYEIVDIAANWEYEITGRIAGFIPYRPKAIIRDMDRRDNYKPLPGQSQVIAA